MDHSFNTSIASQSSTDVAIFIHSIAYWVEFNYSHGQNYNDGRYWTYNTKESLLKFFPYWTYEQLKTIIKKAINSGFILTGNFNKKGWDRTIWYTLSDKALEHYTTIHAREAPASTIVAIPTMHCGNLTNALLRSHHTIPVTKPVTKPDNKKTGIEETVIGIFSLSVKEKDEILLLKTKHMQDCTKSDESFLKECEEHLKKHKTKHPDKHRLKILKGLKTLIIQNRFNKKFKSESERYAESQKNIEKEKEWERLKKKEIDESKIYPEIAKTIGVNAIINLRKLTK